MTIQWFTVVAQIINFLVLVYLLQRFLYGPIVNAMDERQARIARRMEEAEEKRRQAQEEEEEYQRKRSELIEKEQQMLSEMREEVEERRQMLLEQAREDIEELERQWRRALQREQDDFLQDLRRQAARHFYTAAKRALADVADAALDEQAVRAFLRHIRELEQQGTERDEWRSFLQSIRGADGPIVVQSAFDLPDDLRRQIKDALQGYADGRIDLRFETDPDLIAGVQLQAQNHIASWHLDDYLKTLAGHAQASLEAQVQKENEREGEDETETAAEPGPEPEVESA